MIIVNINLVTTRLE